MGFCFDNAFACNRVVFAKTEWSVLNKFNFFSMEQILLYCIVAILTINYLLEVCLTLLNLSNLSVTPPKELEGLYDDEKYKRSQQYEKDKSKLSLIGDTFSFIISIVFLLIGGFAWMSEYVHTITVDLVWSTLLFFGILSVASDILNGKRKLTRDHIERLSKRFNVRPATFFQN